MTYTLLFCGYGGLVWRRSNQQWYVLNVLEEKLLAIGRVKYALNEVLEAAKSTS